MAVNHTLIVSLIKSWVNVDRLPLVLPPFTARNVIKLAPLWTLSAFDWSQPIFSPAINYINEGNSPPWVLVMNYQIWGPLTSWLGSCGHCPLQDADPDLASPFCFVPSQGILRSPACSSVEWKELFLWLKLFAALIVNTSIYTSICLYGLQDLHPLCGCQNGQTHHLTPDWSLQSPMASSVSLYCLTASTSGNSPSC